MFECPVCKLHSQNDRSLRKHIILRHRLQYYRHTSVVEPFQTPEENQAAVIRYRRGQLSARRRHRIDAGLYCMSLNSCKQIAAVTMCASRALHWDGKNWVRAQIWNTGLPENTGSLPNLRSRHDTVKDKTHIATGQCVASSTTEPTDRRETSAAREATPLWLGTRGQSMGAIVSVTCPLGDCDAASTASCTEDRFWDGSQCCTVPAAFRVTARLGYGVFWSFVVWKWTSTWDRQLHSLLKSALTFKHGLGVTQGH